MCASAQTGAVQEQMLREVQFRAQTLSEQGVQMKTTRKLAVSAITAALTLGMIGCSGMSQRDQNTAVGAGIGAVGGAVLTGGSPLGTVGGAAVGGVIGNQISR
jgi:osmotically inducible lipoprotein OsmB